MPSGSLTPLFDWPVKDLTTWDPKTRRHVYPSSRGIPEVTNVVQHFYDIQQRVTAVLDAINYDTGDIHGMIAKDLASPAAEAELALLPKTDYCSVKFPWSISDECKVMLRDKIKRYQRQHAHNLANDGTIDLVLKWECCSDGPQPVRMLPENEFTYVQIAHKRRYKYVDWNAEHAKQRSQDKKIKFPFSGRWEPLLPEPGISSLPATHKGGFYACVIQDLLPFLENLSAAWTASVQVVVQPKLMTEDEQKEMNAYHAARCQAENTIVLEKALLRIEEERAEKEKSDELTLQRQKHSHPGRGLLEWETQNLLRRRPG